MLKCPEHLLSLESISIIIVACWRDAAVMMIMTPLHWASRCPAPVTLAITLRNTLYYTHSYHYTAQAVLLISCPRALSGFALSLAKTFLPALPEHVLQNWLNTDAPLPSAVNCLLSSCC